VQLRGADSPIQVKQQGNLDLFSCYSSKFFDLFVPSQLLLAATMAELFSEEWILKFMDAWNQDAELTEPLASIHFNSTIGYGFKDNATASAYIVVEEGKVVRAGVFTAGSDVTLNWDLRASRERWGKWLAKGMCMTKMAKAYMTGQIKFVIGDYSSMIGNPRMASPFIKSFVTMGKIDTKSA